MQNLDFTIIGSQPLFHPFWVLVSLWTLPGAIHSFIIMRWQEVRTIWIELMSAVSEYRARGRQPLFRCIHVGLFGGLGRK